MTELLKKNKPKICFLVGSVAMSGGTYVIFQHAYFLQSSGYDVVLAVQETFDDSTLDWHDHGHSLNCIPFCDAKNQIYDIVIATWWKTALEIHNFNAKKYGYFVQSIESRFYPAEETALRELVNATYKLPITFVTEASWIRQYLCDNFAKNATLVRNGIRKDIYHKEVAALSPRPQCELPRVLVEGHFNVSFKNTALAVKLARAAGARDIWVMTGSDIPLNYLPGVSRLFSRVPIHKTPSIYSSCDILIKLSTVEGMFGPPLEMFHCGGTALVFDVSGHDEYIVHDYNAIVVKNLDVSSVIAQLKLLLNDHRCVDELKKGAQLTADDWPDWEHSSNLFQRWIELVIESPCSHSQYDIAIANAEAVKNYEIQETARLKKLTKYYFFRRSKALIFNKFPRIQGWIKYVLLLLDLISLSRRVG